jgi:hypothetical protein
VKKIERASGPQKKFEFNMAMAIYLLTIHFLAVYFGQLKLYPT